MQVNFDEFAGPEGPMIHLGSIVGAGVSQFQSKTLGFQLPFFTRFRQGLPSWLSITVQITPAEQDAVSRQPSLASGLSGSSCLAGCLYTHFRVIIIQQDCLQRFSILLNLEANHKHNALRSKWLIKKLDMSDVRIAIFLEGKRQRNKYCKLLIKS
jgi:hypothetical protein